MTVALLLGVLGLTACQNAAGPPPAANIAPVDPAAEARKALAARDWAAAAPYFRAAIASHPDDLTLHYGLAICASWLSLLDEATLEFKWVLAHAPGGSDEARAAREWLAGATSPGHATAAADTTGDPKAGDVAIHGLATWDGAGQPDDVLRRAQLHLRGLPDGPTKGLSYYVRTDKEGRYQFNSIKAGAYKLTDAVAGTAKWNLKVTVGSGEHLELNLSTQNGVSHRNDFPSAGS